MDKSVVSLATKHLDTLYNLASKKQPKALRTKPTQNPLLFVSKHTQKNLLFMAFFLWQNTLQKLSSLRFDSSQGPMIIYVFYISSKEKKIVSLFF